MEITLVSEEDLKRLVDEQGPRSAAANVLRNQRRSAPRTVRSSRGSSASIILSARLPMLRWKPGSGTSSRTTWSPTLNHVAGRTKPVDRLRVEHNI